MATLESIQARIKKLQTQAEAIVAQRAQGALDQIRELMIKHGLTTEDIERRAKARRDRVLAERLGVSGGKAKSATATKGKLPPKYRDPKTGATWSGHARPPAWIKNVKDRSKFLIDPAEAVSEPAVTVKAAAKKTAAKKATARKTAARKTVTAKSAASKVAKKASVKAAGKKTAARKTAAKSAAPTAAKKAVATKTVARKAAAAKTPAKKGVARKVSAKKAPVKTVEPVVETPAAVQAPAETTGEA
ncbi:H-NS histone family protein [Paraburkholderia diazotrophica]|uniref:DNA-binding protein H-NS n=1 Tax=Paraburkholderia diazotrophica TaxID=667676 RepID=A0A1H6Z1M3_9BURK|nr:H-NS histone family protein [Paraburkholderia diazotrophica]SEJ47371.1 DNA-binding protein H-NS [Paraburkholderia diazotrophica]